MLLAVALVALNTFFWVAGPSLGLTKAIVNQLFGNRLIRAEVILQGSSGPEDWLIDRGQITSISGSTYTLRERDGTTATVQIDPRARVLPYRFGGVAQLRRRLHVVVYHQANLAAEIVQVEGTW